MKRTKHPGRLALLSALAATVIYGCVLVPRILDEENGPGDYAQGWWACYASSLVGALGDGDPLPDMRGNYFPAGLPLLVVAVSQVLPLQISSLPLLNFPFILLAFFACYLLAHDLGGARAGLCSMLCLAAHPMVITSAVEFGPPATTMGLTGLALVGLREIRRSSPARAALIGSGVGLAVGAGLYFDRLVVLPMVLPAALYVLATAKGAPRKPTLIGLATVGGVAALSGGFQLVPWIANHIAWVAGSTGIASEDRGGQQVLAPFWSIQSLSFYPLVWFEGQAGPLVAVLALIGVTVARVRNAGRSEPWDWRYVILSLVGVWCLMTLLQKKQTYYTLSVLPASAALAGAGLAWLTRRRALAAVVALLLLNQIVVLPYGTRVEPNGGALTGCGPALTWSHRIGRATGAASWAPEYLRSFGPNLWHTPATMHMGRIARSLCDEDLFEPSSTLALYQDSHGYLDELMLAEFRLACHTNRVLSPVGTAEQLMEELDTVDFAVFVTKDADLEWPETIDPDVVRLWHTHSEEAQRAYLSLSSRGVMVHEVVHDGTRGLVWRIAPEAAP